MTWRRSLFSWLLTAFILSSSTTAVHGAQTRDLAKPIPASAEQSFLSPIGKDMAELLGIASMVDRLSVLEKEPRDTQERLERLKLKQELTDKILIATLQVRDVTARIDREMARLDRIYGYLQNKRDKAIKYNSMANGLGMGVLYEVGQAGEMRSNEIPGEIAQLVSGGVTMTLAGLALKQQSGSQHRVRPKPNMLAKILGLAPDADTEYPAVIWTYLNSAPPDVKPVQTRLDALIQHWQRYHLIGNIKTADGRKRVAALTNTNTRGLTSLNLIEDQAALLADVRAEVFQLDRDLLELLLNTQAL